VLKTNSDYNKIFEQLVVGTEKDSEAWLMGTIAYADYKMDKHSWMEKDPNSTTEDLAKFLRHYDQRTLDKYKNQAKQVLLIYNEAYTEKRVKEILKEEAILKELRGWWKGFWQSVAASVAYTVIIFVLTGLFAASNPKSSIAQIFRYIFSSDKLELRVIEKSQNTQ